MAKFLSAFIVVTSIIILAGFGISIGYTLPGTNPDIVGPFDLNSYLITYFVFIVPNVLLFGALVFAVVTFTRNIAIGFILVLMMLLVNGLTESFLNEDKYILLASLLDPFGGAAISYYTKYWTVAEQNELPLPLIGYVIYNRLIWLVVSLLIFWRVFSVFQFHQNPWSFSFKKKTHIRSIAAKLGSITRVELPKVQRDYSTRHQLRVLWKLSVEDFKYIVKNWTFLSIVFFGLLLVLITISEVGGIILDTPTLPVTWKMLQNTGVFSLSIILCTFLYSGFLLNRSKVSNINQLIDVSPISNWILWGSKLLAIFKMQFILLMVMLVSGILFQLYSQFYHFELDLYLFELFILNFIRYAIWALLAFFIHIMIRNTYLGFFILLVLLIGLPLLSLAGIEQSVFKYNSGGSLNYSDMNGYGTSLIGFFKYRIYWFFGGISLLLLAGLFFVRGYISSAKERLRIAGSRFKRKTAISLVVFSALFFGMGTWIYYDNNVLNTRFSSKEREEQRVEAEKTYKRYESMAQPRIVSVDVHLDLYPESYDFKSKGSFLMVNKSPSIIDTLIVNHNDYKSTFSFNKEVEIVVEDSLYNVDIYKLQQPLIPGDSLTLEFQISNNPNTFFRKNSPVRRNGTFVNNRSLFPTLGYDPSFELVDDKTREKYDLPPNDLRPDPSAPGARANNYISKDSDWIDFEATVSTSKDQIAIAPGYLQKDWIENDRRYFHYKMDSKILNFYSFISAKYEVVQDKWNDVNLEIYYHKGHEFNLDRMMKGMKHALSYNSSEFSPYQHKQLRIIEFPKTSGTFAQAFPNTVPYSEAIGFIADVDEEGKEGVDYPFAITAHEVAHQWWAHQVIGADVLGSTMLSESVSEYSSLKVLEREYGKDQMRTFLKEALDNYLTGRTFESKREKPLMYNDGQGYIHYNKGSLIFYALSDYIGEDKFNRALQNLVKEVQFKGPPYPTSIQMVDYIKEQVPDTLSYLVKDMFETITLYDNKVYEASYEMLENDTYRVDIELMVSKYKNDEKGKRFYGEKEGDTLSYQSEKMSKPILSEKLGDYIEVGIFAKDENEEEETLYLKKHKFTEINNTLSIIVQKEPFEAGIDPLNKLIDISSDDNRVKL